MRDLVIASELVWWNAGLRLDARSAGHSSGKFVGAGRTKVLAIAGALLTIPLADYRAGACFLEARCF